MGTAILILVVLLMAAVSVLSNRLGIEVGLSVALFPMVIMAMTIERMSIVWEERGPTEAIQQGVGSLIVAAIAVDVDEVSPSVPLWRGGRVGRDDPRFLYTPPWAIPLRRIAARAWGGLFPGYACGRFCCWRRAVNAKKSASFGHQLFNFVGFHGHAA